ncbi:MAG: hypothetical protein Fur0022_04570 [Anaerolineales bacterium]
MFKKIIFSPYAIIAVIAYIFLVVLSVFWLEVPLGEALLYCFILTAVGVVVTWWNY